MTRIRSLAAAAVIAAFALMAPSAASADVAPPVNSVITYHWQWGGG